MKGGAEAPHSKGVGVRILYHHRTQAKGAEGAHIRGIVNAFRRAGNQVYVLSPPGVLLEVHEGSRPGSYRAVWKFVSGAAPQPVFEALELGYNLQSLPRLRHLVTRNSIDLIYERYALFGWAGTWVGRHCGVPTVLEINDATVIARSRPLSSRRAAERIEKWAFQNASLLVTVSRRFADLITAKHGIALGRLLVQPNAVDPELFRSPGDVAARAPSDPFTLGMVAAFVPWHGAAFLLDCVAAFLTRTGSRLLLVGDGPERPRLERRIAELHLQSHVTLTGTVPPASIPGYVDAMDVCLLADSNEHGSPMKILEYMAAGKPVLAPDYGPIRDLITHGVDGWIFAPGSKDSLCDGLERLHADAGLRMSLGSAARSTILSHHTWDHRVADLLANVGSVVRPVH